MERISLNTCDKINQLPNTAEIDVSHKVKLLRENLEGINQNPLPVIAEDNDDEAIEDREDVQNMEVDDNNDDDIVEMIDLPRVESDMPQLVSEITNPIRMGWNEAVHSPRSQDDIEDEWIRHALSDDDYVQIFRYKYTKIENNSAKKEANQMSLTRESKRKAKHMRDHKNSHFEQVEDLISAEDVRGYHGLVWHEDRRPTLGYKDVKNTKTMVSINTLQDFKIKVKNGRVDVASGTDLLHHIAINGIRQHAEIYMRRLRSKTITKTLPEKPILVYAWYGLVHIIR